MRPLYACRIVSDRVAKENIVPRNWTKVWSSITAGAASQSISSGCRKLSQNAARLMGFSLVYELIDGCFLIMKHCDVWCDGHPQFSHWRDDGRSGIVSKGKLDSSKNLHAAPQGMCSDWMIDCLKGMVGSSLVGCKSVICGCFIHRAASWSAAAFSARPPCWWLRTCEQYAASIRPSRLTTLYNPIFELGVSWTTFGWSTLVAYKGMHVVIVMHE